MRREKVILLFVIIFLLTNNGFANKKRKIAVLEIIPNNTKKIYAKIVRDIFEVKICQYSDFIVLERDQVKAIIEEQKLKDKQLNKKGRRIENIKYYMDIGKLLSADLVVIGNLNKITKYSISIKFVDVATNNIVLADSEQVQDKKILERLLILL